MTELISIRQIVKMTREELITVAIALLLRGRRKHRYWVSNILQKRKSLGAFRTLVQEMRLSHREEFFRYFRMSPDRFENLLSIVGPRLIKVCRSREPITPSERLAVTVRCLASGDSHRSLYYAYRISCSSISKILSETCQVIWEELMTMYLRPSENEWLAISEKFEESWNVLHAIGAIDGKHIAIQCPSKSGSLYFNYKSYFSLVLLAICDARYCFSFVDIGSYGSNNDSGIFKNGKVV